MEPFALRRYYVLIFNFLMKMIVKIVFIPTVKFYGHVEIKYTLETKFSASGIKSGLCLH